MNIYSKILLIANFSYFSNYFIEEEILNISYKRFKQYWLIQKINIDNNLSEITNKLLNNHLIDRDISSIVYLPLYDFRIKKNIILFKKELNYLSKVAKIYKKIVLSHNIKLNSNPQTKILNLKNYENITILDFKFSNFKFNQNLSQENYKKFIENIFIFLKHNSPK